MLPPVLNADAPALGVEELLGGVVTAAVLLMVLLVLAVALSAAVVVVAVTAAECSLMFVVCRGMRRAPTTGWRVGREGRGEEETEESEMQGQRTQEIARNHGA